MHGLNQFGGGCLVGIALIVGMFVMLAISALPFLLLVVAGVFIFGIEEALS